MAGTARLLDLASMRPPREDGRNGRTPVLLSGFVGSSMSPTLDEADLLEVWPYESGRLVRAGDVILFQPPGVRHLVVHRVVRSTPEGIRTRGDANVTPEMDPWTLRPSDVTGRVAAAWRGSKIRGIAGGSAGRLWARWLLVRRALDRAATRWLHAPYHALARWGIAARLLPRGLKPRVVVFRAGESSQRRLLLVSLALGRQIQARGGILLHGALAARDGRGIVLAGPGSIGKTTASRRLPPPWESLCDDTTLVVKDPAGVH